MMKKIMRKKIPLTLEIAPLIDIIFLLLIFFLLTASLSSQSSQKLAQLDLPEASTAESLNESLVLTITKKGEIFVRGEKITHDLLFFFLDSMVREKKIKKINIQADADVPFKVPIKVMDICRKAGVEEISIITIKNKGG